jgi:hypothetical protein
MGDAAQGVGLVITQTEITVIGVILGSVVSFLVIFALLAYGQSNEVIIARRLVCHFLSLGFQCLAVFES